MAETRTTDPFAPRGGTIASLAARLGCSEGQLYSIVIGVLLLWVVSANALPSVVWDPADTAPARFAGGASNDEVASPAAPAAPSAGLISEALAPLLSPVTAPPPPASTEPAPLTTPPASEPPATDPVSTPDEPDPLRIITGGYASAAAGSPLATVGVPEGSVAVARRAGQPFHVAYLQVTGRGPSLELLVDPEGTSTLDALAGLSLCVVWASGWDVGQGDVALEDAPEYDCTQAVDGVRSETGDRWRFDTSDLDTSAVGGIALVASAAPGSPEFQIVFQTGGVG